MAGRRNSRRERIAVFFVWLVIAFLAGAAGVYIGRLALRNYREVVHQTEKITVAMVAEDAFQFGVSGSLLFFAAYFLGISIIETYTAWSTAEVLEAARLSFFTGVVVLFTSLYQMFSTRKYRQWMMRQK